MAQHYVDRYITCDDDALTIRLYYFPLGTAKRIPYKSIRKIDIYRMGPFTGQWRLWGGTHRYWLNWDPRRPRKKQAIVVELDAFVRPVITPDNIDEVARILSEGAGVAVTRNDEPTPLHQPLGG